MGDATRGRIGRWGASLDHVRAAVVLSALLLGASAVLYSGGYYGDPQAARYHLLYNFLCDQFLSTNYYNGRPNRAGAVLAMLGAAVLIFGALLPVWVRLPARLRPGTRSARVVAGCGLFATLAMLAVALEGELALGWPHWTLIVAAALPACAATAGVMWMSFAEPRWGAGSKALAVALLAGVVLLVAGYLRYATRGALTPPFFAMAQKVLLVMAMCWLCSLPRELPRAPPT